MVCVDIFLSDNFLAQIIYQTALFAAYGLRAPPSGQRAMTLEKEEQTFIVFLFMFLTGFDTKNFSTHLKPKGNNLQSLPVSRRRIFLWNGKAWAVFETGLYLFLCGASFSNVSHTRHYFKIISRFMYDKKINNKILLVPRFFLFHKMVGKFAITRSL